MSSSFSFESGGASLCYAYASESCVYLLDTGSKACFDLFENPAGFSNVEFATSTGLIALEPVSTADRADNNFPLVLYSVERKQIECTLEFKEMIQGIRMRDGYLAVMLSNVVMVYRLLDFTCCLRFDTLPSTAQSAACAFSTDALHPVLACLGLQRGVVRVERLSYPASSLLLVAHESAVIAVALTPDGSVLATASERGSRVRLFSTFESSGACIRELRRAAPSPTAELFFSSGAGFLGALEEAGQVSIFQVDLGQAPSPPTPRSALGVAVEAVSLSIKKCVDALQLPISACASLTLPRADAAVRFGLSPLTLYVARPSGELSLYHWDAQSDPTLSRTVHVPLPRRVPVGEEGDLECVDASPPSRAEREAEWAVVDCPAGLGDASVPW